VVLITFLDDHSVTARLAPGRPGVIPPPEGEVKCAVRIGTLSPGTLFP